MLFDLRGRGRRRTVRAVYLGLAILFGLSFIGFGVGTGLGGGGIFEGLFGSKEGSNGSSYGKQVSSAETRTRKYPSEAAAWAALANARIHEASQSEFYDEATQQFTSQGKQLLAKAGNAWTQYIALNPSKPNVTVAQEMLRVYGQEGLNQPAAAVQVMQLVIAAKPPSAALYGDLAEFAYQSKNTRVGDLASQKAVSLTPAAQRSKVEAELAQIKKNPSGNPSNEVFTGTTNGKVYTVKVGEKGAGTILKTGPAPSTSKTGTTSSTGKK
jgi:hypothetical protein